jgi:AbrB family looped-hinge helix DNA binding protein
MREILATVTGRGQVTVPAEVRRLLGTKKGDKIAFVIDEQARRVSLKAPVYPDIDSLCGAAGSLPRPLSWEQMREIAREDHLDEMQRPTR